MPLQDDGRLIDNGDDITGSGRDACRKGEHLRWVLAQNVTLSSTWDSSTEKDTPQLCLSVYPSPPVLGGIWSPWLCLIQGQALPISNAGPHLRPPTQRGFTVGDEDSHATNPLRLQKKPHAECTQIYLPRRIHFNDQEMPR